MDTSEQLISVHAVKCCLLPPRVGRPCLLRGPGLHASLEDRGPEEGTAGLHACSWNLVAVSFILLTDVCIFH